MSSKTVYPNRLKKYRFEPTKIKGVYRGVSVYNENTTLIVANELEDSSHNASIKLFASRTEEREKALKQFEGKLYGLISSILESSIVGLWKLLKIKGYKMEQKSITVEEVESWGKGYALRQLQANALPVNEVVNAIGLNKIVEDVGINKIVEGVGLEKLFSEVGVEKMEAYLEKLKSDLK